MVLLIFSWRRGFENIDKCKEGVKVEKMGISVKRDQNNFVLT
jgi:hypothetical protein